jgi:hypothetical protein
LRRQVEHGVDTVERAIDGRAIAHIAHHQLDLRIEVIGPRRSLMDLCHEAVQGAHFASRTQQVIREMRSDKAGATCDQNSSGHAPGLSKVSSSARGASREGKRLNQLESKRTNLLHASRSNFGAIAKRHKSPRPIACRVRMRPLSVRSLNCLGDC